jgi:predicted TPR repeat methyltransferase
MSAAAGDDYNRAVEAVLAKRPADALAHVGRALAADPDNPQYLFTSGVCLASLGREAEAVAAYEGALRRRPAHFETLANLGNLHQRAGRHGEAAECYRRALAIRPREFPVLNGLGVSELRLGRAGEAVRLLEEALRERPDSATTLNNLGSALLKAGQPERALPLFRRALERRPDFVAALVNLGELLHRQGDDSGAIAAFDRVLALAPANDEIRFLRAAIAGEAAERAPDQYVRNFFDRFAPEFDQRLTHDLQYAVPESLPHLLSDWRGERVGLRIADLGCGTGLAGQVLRPWAACLVGVDLSGEMLTRARDRGVYDELVEMEVGAFLASQPHGSLDLAVATDVLVYVGRLDGVFEACAAALAPRGAFAFSVEHLAGGSGEFVLARTGRYAHAPQYLRACGERSGLRLGASRDLVIRLDDGVPVEGGLYAFVKP